MLKASTVFTREAAFVLSKTVDVRRKSRSLGTSTRSSRGGQPGCESENERRKEGMWRQRLRDDAFCNRYPRPPEQALGPSVDGTLSCAFYDPTSPCKRNTYIHEEQQAEHRQSTGARTKQNGGVHGAGPAKQCETQVGGPGGHGGRGGEGRGGEARCTRTEAR
jgi:hypothetical protein